jgi:ABC-type sugar transport system ATPase subunit
MTLATRICLVNNGVLQQYAAPLEVYNKPANLFVADFVGNPSMNFVDGKGSQNTDGSFSLKILDGINATFVPSEKIDVTEWRKKRDKQEAEKIEFERQRLSQKGAVEKSNKDEVFKYHVQKVKEEDDSLLDDPVITDEDYVIGIRPEAIDIDEKGHIDTTIYGAMPTGMESTLKLKVGEYLLTGVIFGGVIYKIGQEEKINIQGENILLFDRKSGKLICSGSLRI